MTENKIQSVLIEEVKYIHENVYKPEQSRFSKESVKYWGAKFPNRASKIGNYYTWTESIQPVSNQNSILFIPRSYFVMIMCVNTGKIAKADHYTLSDMIEAETSDQDCAKKHFKLVKQYLQDNKKVNL